MSYYTSVAARVAEQKRKHPERFCPDKRCLWRVVTRQGPNPCRKHPSLQRAAVLVTSAEGIIVDQQRSVAVQRAGIC